ncbi:MAG: DNA repair protein RecN [Ruminococcus sp.]|jgi:DNA repair protein RecN (Recombination protein N)|nr:DNA repair protein RecN [Ruminococcus sp.]
MLREIFIENLAVIERASIPFEPGLNVFTGETGAGKSVLIGGLAAVLGFRANTSLVRTGAARAAISAVFDDFSEAEKAVLQSEFPDIDLNETIILTREIFSDGKSAARINGKPALASQMRILGGILVNIHGQHETGALLDTSHHLELLDNFAHLEADINTYKQNFKKLQDISKELKSAVINEKQREAQTVTAQRTIDEIEKLNIKPHEDEDVERELDILLNAENYKAALSASKEILTGSDERRGISLDLAEVKELLMPFESGSEQIREIISRIKSLIIEVEDIAPELWRKAGGISFSEDKLLKLEARKRTLDSVKRKYGDLEGALKAYGDAVLLLQNAGTDSERIAVLSEQKKSLLTDVSKQAENLSQNRKTAALRLTQMIKSELEFLDMPKAKIEFEFTAGKLTQTGLDNVELMISVNPGEALKPLAKVASGGELSRIMLAIKCITAQSEGISTMVFDEIDTGVSGRAAGKIGQKLREISAERQVLVVTHLAQIAAQADNHLLIEKSATDTATYTEIKKLGTEERIREIARIQVGENITETALQNAREQIQRSDVRG